MRIQIEEQLKNLIGLPLSALGRASDMIWISFGNIKVIKDRFGKEKRVGEYALHIQCSWSFIKSNHIILDSTDLYIPSSQYSGHRKYFDSSQIGNTRFDERVQEFLHQLNYPLTVQSIQTNSTGGTKIILSSDVSIEISPKLSEDHELWRLLRPGHAAPHFVVTSKGIKD